MIQLCKEGFIMIKRNNQEFVEMANNSFVKMMQKVLYYPNGKKYYERLSEEFIPFAKLLLDEYERISPIKFDVPDVELINDKTESDYNTFKARFKEFEDVSKETTATKGIKITSLNKKLR